MEPLADAESSFLLLRRAHMSAFEKRQHMYWVCTGARTDQFLTFCTKGSTNSKGQQQHL